MKYEWKKQEKNLYLPKSEPQIITIPKHKFFAIKGEGNPNGKEFVEKVGVLYSLAYAVRMMPKSGFTPEGYFEYTVYPLEGVWENSDVSDKSTYIYTIMIRQPDFVTDHVVAKAIEITKKKKPNLLLDKVFFFEMEDGLSVQMLHHGDYDNEPQSFAEMLKFMEKNDLVCNNDTHREIYLNDPSKTERNKLKTVLRYNVRNA